MKRCPGCNHQVPDNTQTCDYCGISLGSGSGSGPAEAKRQSTFSFAPDAGKGGEPKRPVASIAKPPAQKAPASEPPLVMVGAKIDAPPPKARREPSGKPQLPMATIGIDEAFKAGLDLVGNVLQILKGSWRARYLARQRDRGFDGLARGVWHLQVRHRDLIPIYDRILDIERQEAEKRAAIALIQQESLAEDPDIQRAERALQKVKIRKLNRAIESLSRSKSPIFRELGEAAHQLRLPHPDLEPAHAHIAEIEARINEAEAAVQEARRAINSIDKRKREFTYLFWVIAIFLAVIILWALVEAAKSPA